MGDQQVKPLTTQAKKEFLRYLLDDIRTLEAMIDGGMIEQGITRIGAEQEYCLVGKNLRPSMAGPLVLGMISDDHFTSELAQWNLEINLDPQDAGSGCFNRMLNQLETLMTKADESAEQFDSRVMLTGILPTIRKSDLDFRFMSPNPRYRTIDSILKELRGEEFSLYIEGVDELSLRHDSILFEACNTSFQIHLQIDPAEFADRYNWAQVIAGPVLASCVNSPVLLGRELWSETRIALFRQSLDVRNAGSDVSDRQPRVAFGYDWLHTSAAEIFKNDMAIYPLIIASEMEGDGAMEILKRGEIPKLRAMNLHNGTLYKWNRACYGVGNGKPHLRIENRYVPAGPTVHDEMANTVFWIGLMMAMPDKCRGQWKKHFWFQDVRSNFLKAARNGLANEFKWFGEFREASRLIVDDLIPMAAKGLESLGVEAEEYQPFLLTIQQRVEQKKTGADWIIDSMRHLREKNSLPESTLIMTHAMAENRVSGTPGHEWDLPCKSVLVTIPDRYQRVDSVMVTRLITISDDDLLDFAEALMEWNGFHHLPVEDTHGYICGIISSKDLDRFRQGGKMQIDAAVQDAMTTDIITVTPETSLEKAEKVMDLNGFGSLPVVREGRVIGIVTASDILALKEKTSQV